MSGSLSTTYNHHARIEHRDTALTTTTGCALWKRPWVGQQMARYASRSHSARSPPRERNSAILWQSHRRLEQATDPLLSTGVRGCPCQCHPHSQKTRSWISIVLTLAAKAVANIGVHDWSILVPHRGCDGKADADEEEGDQGNWRR